MLYACPSRAPDFLSRTMNKLAFTGGLFHFQSLKTSTSFLPDRLTTIPGGSFP
nr:MAG TPA_asm: hypothetical protein [Caudoviricetes sp.]